MFCPECGSRVAENVKFCGRCGSTLPGLQNSPDSPVNAGQSAGQSQPRQHEIGATTQPKSGSTASQTMAEAPSNATIAQPTQPTQSTQPTQPTQPAVAQNSSRYTAAEESARSQAATASERPNPNPMQFDSNASSDQPAQEVMYCMKCGTQMPITSTYCPQCSHKVGAEDKQRGKASELVDKAADRLNRLAGGTDKVEIKIGDFFTDVFKHHNKEESEQLFICGTSTTTPDIKSVATEWPKPWLYSRVLLVLAIVLAGCIALFELFGNTKAIPNILFIGSMVAPFTILIFFFETNVPRNISLVDTVKMFFVGGILSILAIYLFSTTLLPLSGTGEIIPSLLTGFVEEVAKILLIVFFMSRRHSKTYVLNGLLIGAAVGAGFAMFESSGYAFDTLWNSSSYQGTMTNIAARGFLAVGGHVAWASVEGAALALCESGGSFKMSQLANPQFLAFAAICVTCHGLWDAYIPVLSDIGIPVFCNLQYLLLIVAIWFVIAVLLHRGLAEINRLANEARAREDVA